MEESNQIYPVIITECSGVLDVDITVDEMNEASYITKPGEYRGEYRLLTRNELFLVCQNVSQMYF